MVANKWLCLRPVFSHWISDFLGRPLCFQYRSTFLTGNQHKLNTSYTTPPVTQPSLYIGSLIVIIDIPVSRVERWQRWLESWGNGFFSRCESCHRFKGRCTEGCFQLNAHSLNTRELVCKFLILACGAETRIENTDFVCPSLDHFFSSFAS